MVSYHFLSAVPVPSMSRSEPFRLKSGSSVADAGSAVEDIAGTSGRAFATFTFRSSPRSCAIPTIDR